MKKTAIGSLKILLILLLFSTGNSNGQSNAGSSYEALEKLFQEWRAFETPPLFEGAPDYRPETFLRRDANFKLFQQRLNNLDITSWPIDKQVDWHIVKAEMNGYDFNQRILKPWERDPAFYKTIWNSRSDVPAHEGPTHHAVLEVWQYNFPLSEERRKEFITQLNVIPALNAQAKINLTGNAKDLWITGIRDIHSQTTNLENLKRKPGIGKDKQVLKAIDKAIAATQDLATWLKARASSKTGPSGIGKDNYTWYQQNVHLVPMTWEDEVLLLKRELTRAWAGLKLEEHRNRDLPTLTAASTPEDYALLNEKAANSLLSFLEDQDIVTVKDYYEPALKAHYGKFIPEEKRNFFWITAHYDPRPLFSHFYHWFELARMDNEPHQSSIRKNALLYNIFDSRNEGMATAVEELFMQAGLYDDSPRVREIVYIMIAQRAARGLGSLYAHANEMTMEEAGKIHSDFTPRGWMKTEKELLIFEQHLYLRQPGYGTSYITGKYLVEQALAEYARKLENDGTEFQLKSFFDGLNSIGNIPISLGQWQLTGDKEHLSQLEAFSPN
ncbi:hypothetical protein ACFQZJ_14735 [Maribacter chungangensis]|uniref:DUF885 domain-containing protein n=1 Tax=Maribacter chungangensis TaxID=1069117 RepID=A0ABW3B6L3_9FLAO